MRTLTSELQAGVVQPVIRWLWLVKIEFDAGTVAWNTGFSTISYGGVNYVPGGALCSISSIKEETGVKSSSVSLGMSGIKQEVVAAVLGAKYMNRKVSIYRALVDESWVFDPLKCRMAFAGSIDNISGEIGAKASLTVTVKSRLADWERKRSLRYTDADQQKLYPGDKGMEFIPQLSAKKIIWPRAAFLPDPRD